MNQEIEQQAVAWRYKFGPNGQWHYTETPQRAVEAAHGFKPSEALYTRPHTAAPAPVAGDSVLREDWIGDELEKLRNLRSSIGSSDELGEAYNLSCYRFIGKIEAAYDKGGES